MGLEKQQTHKPGALKQTNKSHKHGRHRSSRSISVSNKGKVNLKTISKKQKKELNREQRRNQSIQLRKNKREELLNKKRSIGGLDGVPHLVCILPLHQQMGAESVLSLLTSCDPEAVVKKSTSGVLHITLPRFKQRFALVVPSLDNNLAILDTLKVSDSVVFVVSASAGTDFGAETIDEWGNNILVSAFAQGLPTPTLLLTDLNKIPAKKQNEKKQSIQKLLSKWLPEEKLITLDKPSDGLNIFRKLGNQKRRGVLYRDRRPHLYAEKYEYLPNEGSIDGTLKVTGYLRGETLSVNSLVYVPGLGSFQMSQIDATFDNFVQEKKRSNNADDMESDSQQTVTKILEKADPTKQESLVSENVPDSMDAEQTWPTEEEIKMATEENKKKVKRIPKGWSDYQAAWIPDEDAEEVSDGEDEEDEEDDDGEFMDAVSEVNSSEGDEKNNIEEFDSVSQSEVGVNDQQYDQQIDLHAERTDLQKIKDAKMDRMFPDEVDTPQDVTARIRYQKYRGLESFRTSPWDPKENLPIDYSRIFQFENFDRTKRRVLKEQEDSEGSLPGWFITVHVKAVPKILWKEFEITSSPVIIIGMFPHENKMSVLNTVLKRTGIFQEPIKSKERLIFQCGYRRFIVNPIFSQHTNGKKHKFERYFQPESTSVATFFAPIQFPPAPILCYKEVQGQLKLIATGSLLSCNPDRIVLKRIALSGHPLKVHKRSAVIRFMFFNREDIVYFKPCKLRTKLGRTGHIKEALGTHGHMKCIFDSQLKSQDTILLNLYKRMFPKWTYEESTISCTTTDNTGMAM